MDGESHLNHLDPLMNCTKVGRWIISLEFNMKTNCLICLILVGCLVGSTARADDYHKPLPLRKLTPQTDEVKQPAPVDSPVSAPVEEHAVDLQQNVPAAAPVETVVEKVPVSIRDESAPVEIQAADSTYFIEVGTRILYVELLNDSQGPAPENSYIGSITGLDADQDYTPARPYIQVMIPRNNYKLGVGISYDHMTVATVDDGGGDGDIDMTSLQLYLVAACTSHPYLSPYGEIGLAMYDNSFEPHADWSDNGTRSMHLDDTTVPYFALGCDVKIDDDWSVDLYLRYVDVDVDGEYIFKPDGRDPESFTFTLEHLAYGLGVKYVF